MAKKGNIPWNKGKQVMTQEQKDHLSKVFKGKFDGSNHPQWKGGRQKAVRGYIKCYVCGHPYAYKNSILEHRLVMERHIGRYLLRTEVVHHINKIHNDNRIENLMLFKNHAAHRRFEKGAGRKKGVSNV